MMAFGVVGVTLFVKLPLLISFSHDCGLVIADVEHDVAASRWEPWDQRETRRVRWWIQIIFIVFKVFSLGVDRACRSSTGVTILRQCMNRAFIILLDTLMALPGDGQCISRKYKSKTWSCSVGPMIR
jgi:hypothetical protein